MLIIVEIPTGMMEILRLEYHTQGTHFIHFRFDQLESVKVTGFVSHQSVTSDEFLRRAFLASKMELDENSQVHVSTKHIPYNEWRYAEEVAT